MPPRNYGYGPALREYNAPRHPNPQSITPVAQTPVDGCRGHLSFQLDLSQKLEAITT